MRSNLLKFRLTLFTIVAILVFLCPGRLVLSVDSQPEADRVKYILLQMSAVINSRNPDKIKSFFSYYTSKEARFLKQSLLLNPKNQNIINKQEKNSMTREEYMNYLVNIVGAPDQYAFWLEPKSFKVDADGKYAVVSTSIREIELTSSKSWRKKDEIYIKIVVSTNCNFSFNIQPLNPIITGSSCVEKIVIQ